MKTFFGHIKDFFVKLFGVPSSWETTALNTLHLVAPLLETVISLTAGAPAAAKAQAIITQIENDLTTAGTLITAVQQGSGTGAVGELQSVLGAVKTNLGQILEAAQVKDTNTQAKVTALVNMVAGELDAILEAMPAQPPTPSAPPAA